jgi:uncharacterized repeat protein (TIGR02543 family)
MKRNKSGFLALVGLAAVAGLFTLCKANGAGAETVAGSPAVAWSEFSHVTEDGKAVLTFTFDRDVAGFSVSFSPAVTAAGEIWKVAGTGVYEMDVDISGVDPNVKTFQVGVKKSGIVFSPAGRNWELTAGPSYTVTFDKNGGDTEADPATATATDPDYTVSLPTTNPTRSGYAFTGWNTEEEGGGDEFTGETTVSESITVWAQWLQLSPSQISGTITTSDAERTKTGIAVQLKSGGDAVGSAVYTDAGGDYTIDEAPAGTYTIEVSLDGWKTALIEEFTVTGTGDDITDKDAELTHKDTYALGETGPAGGLIFYVASAEDKETNSWEWTYLEAAMVDITGAMYGGYGDTVGTTEVGIGTGKSNTETLVTRYSGQNYAANRCAAANYGGFSGWFLPSHEELNLMYLNLKVEGLGNFSSNYYLSSSETNYVYVKLLDFSDGYKEYNTLKNTTELVRAARAF